MIMIMIMIIIIIHFYSVFTPWSKNALRIKIIIYNIILKKIIIVRYKPVKINVSYCAFQ